VSPYNDPDIIAGAGTIGVEVMDDWPEADTLLVPLGGGGLAAGVSCVMKARAPGCRTIGVELTTNPAFRVARVHGAIPTIPVLPSLADGLTGNIEPGSITFPLVERYLDDLIGVDEEHIAPAIVSLASEERVIVEGAGAIGVAAAANQLVDLTGRRVVIIVS